MNKGLFITSSGTEIGKTYVTALLCRQLRAKGAHVEALKPVVSGFSFDEVEDSDPGQILSALGRELSREEVEEIAPWRFTEPLSPDMAAARENREIEFEEVVAFCRAHPVGTGPLLVEGVGGVMAPLCHDKLVIDWAEVLGLPAILVVGSYLGTISHTLTAYETLKARNLSVRGIVISPSPEQPVPPGETAEAIGRFAQHTPIHILKRLPTQEWAKQPDLTSLLEVV